MTTIGKLLVAVALVIPVSLRAQLPGKNLSATVRVRSVTMYGDTAAITYSVLNGGGSAERLESFTVSLGVGGATVTSPSPDSLWSVTNALLSRTVARWTSLLPKAPGDSTPTLSVRAIGLPGIRVAWYSGDSMIVINSATQSIDLDALTDLSNAVVTVGVDASLTSLSTLVPRLKTLTDSSCALSWITNSGLCTALSSALAASPSQVLGYTTRLDSARSGGSAVTDAAYFMLKANAEYIKSFVDTSVVQLHVICAGTWLVRNFNYASFTGHWATDVHSDTLTVAGRGSDAHEYTDVPITTAGTYLNLYFNGVAFRSRNRGTWSCY